MVKDILGHEITGKTILLCHVFNRAYFSVIHVNVQFHFFTVSAILTSFNTVIIL